MTTEQILNTLHEIHIAALESGAHVFGVTSYRWDTEPELGRVITLHVVKKEGDESFGYTIHEGDEDEANAAISQLKIYLGL